MMTVGQAVPELLSRHRARTVFGVLGSANVVWVGYGVKDNDLRWIATRHEATAVMAAGAYSRTTGDIGVASTTMGPGFGNAVNALAALRQSHIPIVLIVGESPTMYRMHGDFQQLNQCALAEALGVGYHAVHQPEELCERFTAAFRQCRTSGVAQVLAIEEGIIGRSLELPAEPGAEPVAPPRPPDPAVIGAVVDLLESAERPLILAGQGALLSGCRDDIVELSELVGARLAGTLSVGPMFAGHPRNLGVCGVSGSPVTAEQVALSDVVVAAGASLNSFTTREGGSFPAAKVVQCEIDVEQPFRASSEKFGLFGDVGASIRALSEEWRRRGLHPREPQGRVPSRAEVVRSVCDVDLGHDPGRGLDVREVYVEFNRQAPRNRVVVSDSGRAVFSVAALVEADGARRWFPYNGYASTGVGLGAAIGAAIACPDRKVVLFSGDGGFMGSAQELDTIREYDLDVCVVVVNDRQYGSEVKYLRRAGLPGDVVTHSMPDLRLFTEAFGGTYHRIHTPEDLRSLDFSNSGLIVFDVWIDPVIDATTI